MEKKTDVTEEHIDRLLETFAQLNHCNIWSRVSRKDFTVRRFALGFVNDICCCELTDEARKRLCRNATDFPAVTVKYVPDQTFFKNNPVETAAIQTMIAENGLGPKLVLIAEKCHITEYIKSRNYNNEDDTDDETVRQLARVLARFHALKPPVSKDAHQNWQSMFDDVTKMDNIGPLLEKTHLEMLEKNAEFKKKYYKTLSLIDVKEIFDSLRDLIKKLDTPHVFAHCDFNRGNRIVQLGPDESGNLTKRIYLLDFDYANYNNRGIDFGRYFSNYRHEDDMFGDEGFPTDQEMELFLGEYLGESARLVGSSYLEHPANTLNHMRDESKLFTLNAYAVDAFFGLFMYINNPDGPQAEYFLNLTKTRFEGYLKLKKRFVEDGSLDRIKNNTH